jgi:hypothetical protein
MTPYVCEHCRGMAVRTAKASLEMLSDCDSPETTRSIAVDELTRAVDLLHLNTARRADDGGNPDMATL